jgi:hypothetical protein
MSGIAKSSKTKSGFNSLNFLTPDHPSSASPQTVLEFAGMKFCTSDEPERSAEFHVASNPCRSPKLRKGIGLEA